MSRRGLAQRSEIASYATRPRALTQPLIAVYDALLNKHHASIRAHFEDMPEVRDWVWTDEVRPREVKS